MQEYGTLTAQVVTSNAQIPVQGAAIAVTSRQPNGRQELLAVRLSNYDGFTEPVEIFAPPQADSQTRQEDALPYTRVDVSGTRNGYDRVLVRGAQVFSGIQTLQQLVLIPTPTLPESYAQTQEFDIPAQEL